MRVSDAGLAKIRSFEGFRANAYMDPGSINGLPITIGFGSTRWEDGSPIRMGDHISEERAAHLLRLEVAETEEAVNEAVTVPMTQEQFDALVSFAYNVGISAFKKSTLLRKLNAGDTRGAAREFLRWNLNDGRVMAGLTKRRHAEMALFLTGLAQPEKPMAPFVAAALPALVSAIPQLAKLFGSGSEVSQRNARAAEAVVSIVQEAVGATNAQDAAERVQADPAARQAASEAVNARWFDLQEAGGGGIKGAREFNVQVAQIPAWRMPAVWVSAALLALVFMVVGTVLWAPGWSNDIRLQVVTAVLTVIGMVGSFWLGTSAGSQRKTDILAEK